MSTLLILFEHLSATEIGCYGGRPHTPHLDSLAANGDLFTACYADHKAPQLKQLLEESALQTVSSVIELRSQGLSKLRTNLVAELQVLYFQGSYSGIQADEMVEEALAQLLRTSKNDRRLIISSLFGEAPSETDLNFHAPLRESAAHIPLIIAIPGQTFSRRRSQLLTTAGLTKLVRAATQSTTSYHEILEEAEQVQIEYRCEGAVATRTREWLLIQNVDNNDEDLDPELVLYRKPEDLWEQLDVAEQYPQLVDHFLQTGHLTFPSQI